MTIEALLGVVLAGEVAVVLLFGLLGRRARSWGLRGRPWRSRAIPGRTVLLRLLGLSAPRLVELCNVSNYFFRNWNDGLHRCCRFRAFLWT